MRKIIWSCWFQGRRFAPDLVRNCLQSWQDQNPDWDFRCLDASTIPRYVDLAAHVDLARQRITAASLSDILRLLLLHEYGGVWVDATTFCNAPLDGWLEQAGQTGFFAFARPAEDREIATWFLAAAPGNSLVAKWTARAISYWQGRGATRDYFWVHHQFGELLAIDRGAFGEWQAVPRISADGPHSIQTVGFYENCDSVSGAVDWSAPVFKLTYRLDADRLGPNTVLARILARASAPPAPASAPPTVASRPATIAGLRVGTENLGDHIQIIAGEQMLARAGLAPCLWVDRDDEIANPPAIVDGGGESGGAGAGIGIMLNGWFKTNPSQWPPHPDFLPAYLGFHIRLFQSPSLVAPAALAHYQQHGPVGCRDRYTLSLLRGHGVEAFLSYCLTLSFRRRLPDPDRKEIFVVSRDRTILAHLPDSLGPFTFLSQYSGAFDFTANLQAARDMLEMYRTRAALIITTMLHCALPAIAMGIPVVVFYPPNDEAGRRSDKERFSSLSDIVRVFELSEANIVDWLGYCPDVGDIKLRLIDAFFAMVARWGAPATPSIAGIAAPSVLPVPKADDDYAYFGDLERLNRLAAAHAPDRLKWGAKSSYRPEWNERAQQAARHIVDGERVLEIGAGAGPFRAAVAHRCRYTGADLQPVDPQFLTLDLERDPLPAGIWDTVVLLGVLEYIFDPQAALSKIFGGTDKAIISYCCARPGDVVAIRRGRGWVNELDETEFARLAHDAEFEVAEMTAVNSAEDFSQSIFLLLRAG